MELQEPLKYNMARSPQSWKKRLIAQPLNGSSTITIGSSSSTQTRIEIPSCCNYIGDIEIGYQMNLSDPIATNNMVYMPAHYLPEIQRIEIYPADSTNKMVDLTNANIYSRMTSSLFNNFKNRSVSQRINFLRDLPSNQIAKDYASSTGSVQGSFMINNPIVTADGANQRVGTPVIIQSQRQFASEGSGLTQGSYTSVQTLTNSSFSDAYFNDSTSRAANANLAVPPTDFNQQEYLPMGVFQTTTSTGNTINLFPVRYNFNFKLKDFLHDSILSNLKCMYHRSNLVIIIYWNPVNQILFQVPTTVLSTGIAGLITTPPLKAAAPTAYNGSATLNISNLFIRYYAEMNPQICEELKNATYEVAYPFLYQANLNLSPGAGGQLGVNLIVGNEGESRIYRVYCGLQGMVGSFLPSDNFTNIQYKKWNGNVELYFNNDLYQRITSDYGDWDATMMPIFKDGSLNSTTELQNLGVIAFHFDSSEKNGCLDEYDDNILKGKITDQFININPRWLTVQNDGNTNAQANYTGYVFAVVIRKGIIDKGEFKIV